MKLRRTVAMVSCLAMTACVTQPSNITARYVSPVGYQTWDCTQLGEERSRVSRELAMNVELQQGNANADAVMLTVGLIILPIVALGMLATKERKEEIARLKGEEQALREAMRGKNCAHAAVPPAPPVTAPVAPPTTPPAVGKQPKCDTVGGYEAYRAKTGQVCSL